MWLWCPIMKRMEIIMWIHVHPNWKTNFNSKNSRNRRSFFFETKALISLIPMRIMCLWCPILKRKEIIIWIHIYPNWEMNMSSKNGRKISFSYETEASILFFPMRRMRLWHLMMKRNKIIMSIHVYPNWKMNFESKNGRKKSFPMEPKHQIRLSQ